ncbi:MAG: excinuclease ABC subunit UvrC [Oscillospiraceae bacterium]|nr:excinuclease ABC subunit UvrC [Oscillospiraceae bacterium]
MEFKVDVHEKALGLPEKPGVYLMLNRTHEVIYVGKAKCLPNRVSSYFRPNPNHNEKTRVMVSKVWDFDYIVTDTEFEALVLENSLIKRHMPRYNILLKDDKGYPFIRLSVGDSYPNFTVVSKPLNDGARYFGPYGGRGSCFKAIDAVRSALGIPSCKRVFPREIGRGRPCLNYHMGKCRGVCAGQVSPEEYRTLIDAACAIFDGKAEWIIEQLHSEMEQAAENLEFERAAKLRDEMKAIERLCVKQNVLPGMAADTDVIALYPGESKTVFAVLHYIGGALLESETHVLETPVYAERSELLSGFIRQYYMPRKLFPKQIYLSDAPEDIGLLSEWMTNIQGAKVTLSVPQRGEKRKLVALAEENAKEKAARAASKEEVVRRTVKDLQDLLGLETPPHRIEAYDISNTSGKDMVGSMVVFEDDAPKKKDYRIFAIKTLQDQDDCAAMREVLSRRIKRLQSGDEKFAVRPDVILLDGALGQVHAVQEELNLAGETIPLYGMVKDDRHRTRAIVNANGDEIGIAANPAVFQLVGKIQEEVHRVAIEYHRKLRYASTTRSGLKEIPGIGEKRHKALLKHFGSLAAIRKASVEELSAVLPRNAALAVFERFRANEEEHT